MSIHRKRCGRAAFVCLVATALGVGAARAQTPDGLAKVGGPTAIGTLPTPHLSYGRLPTYSGIVVDYGTKAERTLFFDAAEYDGHLDFVVRALGRRMTAQGFLKAVSFPQSRRYFPFLLYQLPEPLTLDGKKVDFLLRPQRYRFRDSHRQLGKLLADVLDKIDRSTSGAFGTGAVMLYDGTRRRPNWKTSDALTRRQVTSIPLKRLLAKVGASRVQVLHPGEATGRLVRVKANSRPSDFGPDVIAVYDAVPDVAPTFAGIITLEPQTPLSHINLLAKNRGTVNLSAQGLDDIDGLAALIGKPVQLVASLDDGRGGQVTIRPVSAKAFAAATKRATASLAIPTPVDAPFELLPLTFANHGAPGADLNRESASAMVRRIGAKATGYGRLMRVLGRGAIRPASALSFGAYLDHMKRSGAQRQVVRLAKQRRRLSRDAVNAALVRIRRTIEHHPLDPSLTESVRAHLHARYPGRKVRLRSSTNCEDLSSFNGAGLYLSKGLKQKSRSEVAIRKKLATKLRAVFASLWTERAFWEREFSGIDQTQAAMAILMHPAFPNEFGDGVALTLDGPSPMERARAKQKKRRNAQRKTTWPLQISIQAQRGGAGVTHPKPGQVAESFTFREGGAIPGRIDAAGSEGEVLLATDAKTRAALVLFIERMKRVHAAFVIPARQQAKTGAKKKARRKIVGVDVEFKVLRANDGDVSVVFKQARLLSTPLPATAVGH